MFPLRSPVEFRGGRWVVHCLQAEKNMPVRKIKQVLFHLFGPGEMTKYMQPGERNRRCPAIDSPSESERERATTRRTEYRSGRRCHGYGGTLGSAEGFPVIFEQRCGFCSDGEPEVGESFFSRRGLTDSPLTEHPPSHGFVYHACCHAQTHPRIACD